MADLAECKKALTQARGQHSDARYELQRAARVLEEAEFELSVAQERLFDALIEAAEAQRPPKSDAPVMYSPKEAAVILRLHPRTVYGLLRDPQSGLTFYRDGRKYQIPGASLTEYVQAKYREANPTPEPEERGNVSEKRPNRRLDELDSVPPVGKVRARSDTGSKKPPADRAQRA